MSECLELSRSQEWKLGIDVSNAESVALAKMVISLGLLA